MEIEGAKLYMGYCVIKLINDLKLILIIDKF